MISKLEPCLPLLTTEITMDPATSVKSETRATVGPAGLIQQPNSINRWPGLKESVLQIYPLILPFSALIDTLESMEETAVKVAIQQKLLVILLLRDFLYRVPILTLVTTGVLLVFRQHLTSVLKASAYTCLNLITQVLWATA